MGKVSRDEIIGKIQSVAKLSGNPVLSKTQFLKNSDITISDVLRVFPKWSDACIAAGIEPDRTHDQVPDDELLIDWGRVTRELGKPPALTEYKINGKHSRKPFDRFGKWVDLPVVFMKRFSDTPEWKDVLEILERVATPKKVKKPPKELKIRNPSGGFRWQPKSDRPIYGNPIDFRGLRHEPVNEQGVVFLFGMVAHELGYQVEAIQGGFPDCEAKRKVSSGQWQRVQIEFEYESKNFVDHSHDPKQCDVIVCWKHNWEDCPEELEVLVLSEVIKDL